MTTTDENTRDEQEDGYGRAYEFKDIAHRVRYIQSKVNDICAQVDDSYHLLREIADATLTGNGTYWFDEMYENGRDYD